MASEEGLIANGTSIHAGLRTRLWGKSFSDYDHDENVGFVYIEADGNPWDYRLRSDIDTIGTKGVVDAIINTVGTTNPVYLSIDIDVIDPGICPGTGTPESGGWTTRELRQIIRGLEPLRIVGGDIVEVSPPYDNAGETTALAAADLAFEMISIMVKNPGFEGPKVDVAKPRLPKLTSTKRDHVEL
jgi:agmatinase